MSACNVGDPASIPGLGRFPGKGNGNPFQYPCLENPMDRGALYATVHGVTKNQTRLRDFTFFTKRLPSKNVVSPVTISQGMRLVISQEFASIGHYQSIYFDNLKVKKYISPKPHLYWVLPTYSILKHGC